MVENKINTLKTLLEIQGKDGNWNYSDYMTGLYNGLELALSYLEDRKAIYKEVVKK